MNKEKNRKAFPLSKLTMIAVFIALIAVLTSFPVAIPGGHGYIHLGDSMIYTCAWALGGPAAGVASAAGSALADILLGYPQYAIATLIIKFLMAYICYLIMKAFSYKMGTNIFAMAIASLIMVAGYVGYEYILSGRGGAVVVVIPNLIQAVGGVVLGAVFVAVLNSIRAFDPYIKWKADKQNEQN